MAEREDKSKDMSRIVEQTTSSLQEVERNLDALRADVQALAGRSSALAAGPSPFGSPSNGAPVGLPLFRSGGLFAAPFGPSAFPSPSAAMANGFVGATAALPGAPGMGDLVRSVREIRGMPPMNLAPTVCLVDQGDEFVLWADLPGVKKDDLDILCGEHSVTITAESRLDVEDGVLLLAERGPVRFRRTVALPRDVQTGHVKATVKDGVLTLRIPKKTPGSGPRRVDVAFG